MSWGYERSKCPPTEWEKQFPVANGKRQSPIDIITGTVFLVNIPLSFYMHTPWINIVYYLRVLRFLIYKFRQCGSRCESETYQSRLEKWNCFGNFLQWSLYPSHIQTWFNSYWGTLVFGIRASSISYPLGKRQSQEALFWYFSCRDRKLGKAPSISSMEKLAMLRFILFTGTEESMNRQKKPWKMAMG